MERGLVDGFRFVDRKYGESYINVGVQDAVIAPALKDAITSWLMQVVKPGAELKLGVLGCGAGGRIEVLDSIEPAPSRRSSAPDDAADGTAGAPPSLRAQDGRWSYGPHPVLGLSAHVNVAGETFGLACGFAGTDLLRGDAVSVRMTPGVSTSATRPGGVLFFYDRVVGGGNHLFQTAGAYLESRENACGTLKDVQRARRLIVAEGRQISLQFKGSDPITTIAVIEQRGVTKTIRGDKDLGLLVDAKEFPLTGSGSAIRQLIDACPGMKADLRNDCGV